jgi:hypothetical protein
MHRFENSRDLSYKSQSIRSHAPHRIVCTPTDLACENRSIRSHAPHRIGSYAPGCKLARFLVQKSQHQIACTPHRIGSCKWCATRPLFMLPKTKILEDRTRRLRARFLTDFHRSMAQIEYSHPLKGTSTSHTQKSANVHAI